MSGFQDAKDVSVKGLKYKVSSLGLRAKPNPCEDFLPAKDTGMSSNSAGGPLVSVAVGILKILETKKSIIH